MKRIKSLIVLGAFALVSSFASAASPNQLNYCLGANPEGFDPRAYTGQTTLIPLDQMYEPLVDFNYDTQKIEPALATSWEVSADGLIYTFHLRKGVKFHTTSYFKPTRDFNADDVVFSIMSQLNPNDTLAYTGNSKWASSVGWTKDVQDVKKVDDYTVQFLLKRPKSTFLTEAIMYQDRILSKEYAEAMLKKGDITLINKLPIGTGPYQYVDFQKDNFIRMTANKNYWGDKAKIEKVSFAVVNDPNVGVTKLEKNECDYTEHVSLINVVTVKNMQAKGEAKNIAIVKTPVGRMQSLVVNVKHNPAMTNVKVRQAISYAIDYDKILKDVFQGYSKRATTGVPSSIPGWDSTLKPTTRDIAKAKQLLAEAKVDPKTIKIQYWARPNNQASKLEGEILQANLKEIGISVEVVSYEWGTFLKKVYVEGQADLADLGWLADIPDASNFLDTQFSCAAIGENNGAAYCSEAFDNLGKKAMATTNQEERNKYFAEQQKLLNYVDVAQIPLAEPPTFELGNSDRLTEKSLHRNYANPHLKDFELKK